MFTQLTNAVTTFEQTGAGRVVNAVVRTTATGTVVPAVPTAAIQYTIADQYTDHPNERDFSLVIGGANGTPTTLADFRRMMRATLFETYEDNDSVTGVFGPRCGKHVGLEAVAPFGAHTTPETTNTSPIVVTPNSAQTFHDTLWEWLDVGSGTRQDVTRIDLPTGAALSGC